MERTRHGRGWRTICPDCFQNGGKQLLMHCEEQEQEPVYRFPGDVFPLFEVYATNQPRVWKCIECGVRFIEKVVVERIEPEESEFKHSLKVDSILYLLPSDVQVALSVFEKLGNTVEKFDGVPRSCQYLTITLPSEDGKPTQEHLERFGMLINNLIKWKLVFPAMLAEPMCVEMTDGRILLVWYPFSPFSRAELNEKLGCDCFVVEGSSYDGPWPKAALVEVPDNGQ